VNESPEDEQKGKERDFSEFARPGSPPPESPPGSGGAWLRGCGIALGIAFLVLVFVVGACFMSL
jgi:hypothetical protein